MTTRGKATSTKKNAPTKETTESDNLIDSPLEPEEPSNISAPSSSVSSAKENIETDKPQIRIIFQGTCSKLTKRGKGNLTYEIGIDDTGNSVLRIAGNETGGTFSTAWVSLDGIKDIIEANSKDQESFRSSILMTLFPRKSNNNHGYLAAILRAEGVLKNFPEQPAHLIAGSWDNIIEKMDDLKSQDISLSDHIAIALEQREEKKKQLKGK